jgi:hypothetical protein
MKQNILIYSIFRNSGAIVDTYYHQLREFVTKFSDQYNFFLSIYENDSKDNTKEKLQKLDLSFIKHSLISENINTPTFSSIPDENRVRNIAAARNKAIHSCNFLPNADWVMMLESDLKYDIDCIEKLLNFKSNHNLKNVDIVSAILWEKRNKHYDTWGTRRNAEEYWGGLFEDWSQHDYKKYYATCNGIALFKAEAIRKGAIYDGYSKRFKKFDCDTANICEKFHEHGYSDIFINHKAHCYHLKNK